MKILIANVWLDKFQGTETWCYAMAVELMKRGHQVDVYTPMKGKIFKEFEKIGCKFSDHGKYDLILDNHNQANRRKFEGFVIHTCHGIVKEESPMPSADINVAVSKKAAAHWNLPIIISNGIDTNRFNLKKPVHKYLTSVLSLCKSDTANDVIRSICYDAGVKFKAMYGKEVFNIEDEINDADLVVGVGRSLLDAMACGRPVVSFDDRMYFKTRMLGHGYITPDKFAMYEADSFTGSSTDTSLNKLELAKEIFKYNPNDGEVNRQFILDELTVGQAVDAYLKIYEENKK